MSDKMKKGKEAEDWAAEFLTNKGYKIIERNYRVRHAEIDIIARNNNWLIFIEVKMRSSDLFGMPEDFVDFKKVQNILWSAENYTYIHNWQGNVRYDIISIRHINGTREIYHIEDAFY